MEYLAVEKNYSSCTTQAYERDLQEFCSFLDVAPEQLQPKQVSLDDVRMWVASMIDRGDSPRSVKRRLSALRSFYRYLLRIGYTDCDITRAVIAPKVDKPLPVFFKESEMQAEVEMMTYADDYRSFRDNLIIEMLYETGMRRAEMAALTDGDIDMQQQQVRIFGKRKKERIVPFGDKLADMIRTYYAYRQSELGIETAPQQPLFLSNTGRPVTTAILYNIVRARMSEVSTLKKHSPHVLRHTFATQMLAAGADINSIRLLMGHASLSTTQVYTHTSFEQLRKAYENAHPRAKKPRLDP